MSDLILPPKFDVFDPALLDDPYPTYARLRDAGALCRAGPATFAVTRHAEVSGLLRDHRLGHGMPTGFQRPPLLLDGTPHADVMARVRDVATPNAELPSLVSALDPPEHTRIRGLLTRALNPSVVRGLQPVIARVTDELIAGLLDRQHADLVGDFALPLQMRVVCDLLGIPQPDRTAVADRAAALGRAIILIPFVTPERGNGEQEAKWLRAYVGDLVRERRARPGTDLVSAMLDVRQGEAGLAEDEVIDNAVFLFFAGFETTIHLVAGGCLELARRPAQWGRLVADRSLVPTAVEEILRFDAPLQWISRITVAPVEVGDRVVRPGRFLLLLLASANRDARRFRDPDELDVGRHPNPHLGFGGGAHHCLGVLLARTQAAVVFDRLASRCAMEPAGEPVRRRHPNVRSYAAVPMAVRPA